MADSFLRQQSRTQHFSLGQPRNITIAGNNIFFVRSKGGEDAVGCLWAAKITNGELAERLLVDPQALHTDADIPEAERRRRERLRERAAGVTAFSVDEKGERLAMALAGDIYMYDLLHEDLTCLVANRGGYDPRISPDGASIAFIADGTVQLVDIATKAVRTLIENKSPNVTWGITDFIAAEEMRRMRGFWWAPDSQSLLVEKVDNSQVAQWYIADPSQPESQPSPIRYPAAGSKNAQLSLAIVRLDGACTMVQWDTQPFEYLVDVIWDNALYITVQSRDQRKMHMLRIADDGTAEVIHELTDSHWVEIQPGLPCITSDGSVISWHDSPATRLLTKNSTTIMPDDLLLQTFYGAQKDGTLHFTASQLGNAKSWHFYELTAAGALTQLSEGEGLHDGYVKNDIMVRFDRSLENTTVISAWQRVDGAWVKAGVFANMAVQPALSPKPQFFRTGEHNVDSALLLPQDHDGHSLLPILLAPYGGPGVQCVVASKRAYYEAQWYANQGFAVIITDGRGMAGHSPSYEKAIAGNLIDVVLEDQIAALRNIAARYEFLDTSRVGIHGWSFGGYLAAYAVVRHPDIFRAAIAGAPVTDWRFYDTHYTERYLGKPDENAAAYDSCSLLKEADKLGAPLLIIHGLADDNVFFRHTLEFSAALLAAGKSHQVLPLSGATHMPVGEEMTENLEKLQLEFLRQHLGVSHD